LAANRCAWLKEKGKNMAVNLSPIGGAAAQFFDNNGVPLSGGKIETYAAGTSTPQATYTSSTGLIAHSNPIILDSAGRVPGGEIWLTTNLQYKFVLRDANNTLIGTYDNINLIPAAPFVLISNFTGDGVTTSFVLAQAPINENYTNVYVTGVYQNKNTYVLAGSTITFSTAPPNTASIEIQY
jgi:hypothetical protein